MTSCKILADDGNLCGEGPLWDSRTKKLYWNDCLSLKLFAFDPATNERTIVLDKFEVNGIALNEPGGFVFSNNLGVWLWDGFSAPVEVVSCIDQVRLQLNDCIADPCGRFLAGTNFYAPDQAYPLGHLISVQGDGIATILDEGVHLANGLGFSPDATTLYFADSAARTISSYTYDLATGSVKNKRTFVQLPNHAGLPDGLTVDEEGFVWSAEWYGGCITRYDPEGTVERRVAIPAKQSSSLAFGGPELTDIFVTSASRSEPMSIMPPAYDATNGYFGGALFGLNLGIRGRAEYKANISISNS